jgi:hypothetical protein
MLYMNRCGPLLAYENGMLRVEDLNPEMKTRWTMSRWEMFRTGLRFLLAAVRGR